MNDVTQNQKKKQLSTTNNPDFCGSNYQRTRTTDIGSNMEKCYLYIYILYLSKI